ncbi:MFS transporter [Rhodoligotrophos defluvii]|uniref:MFS transporter n=1 Tax=Rhodoligotrophos defluvii TaxID=2561934 RepID=UPI0010C9DCA1|nr:MFS transporter [Rhodoligotrophos defluvii]
MSTGATDASTPEISLKATPREWLGLLVIAMPCLLYSMDLTVLNLAVPALSADLKPSATQLLWIVDIYGFMVAGWLITMGSLGDRIGRRLLLMAGATAFGAASILAAFSTTAEMLIFARALLGVAGATIAPSTLSLIRNMFRDEQQRTFAISIWGTSYAAGGLIGPILGGVLLQFFPWGSVFLLAVPVMVLVLVSAPLLLPEYRDPNAGRADITSAALSLAAVLSAIYGLKQIAEYGPSLTAILFILVGLGLGLSFVQRQRRLADPFIDLSLFRSPALSTALAINLLGCLIMFGTFLYIAQYLQLVLGLTPLAAALWSIPSAATVTAGSMLAPLVVNRYRPAHVIAGGMGLLGLGMAMLTQLDHGGLPLLVAGTVVLCAGLGPTFVLTTDIIVSSAPPERAGAASAISETGAEFGGVVGIAVLGSIGVAVYRSLMGATLPSGLSADAAEAARGSLGGAAAVARSLDGAAAAGLLDAARAAFTQAMAIATGLCALLALAGAIAALMLLRNARRAAAH